MFMLLKSSQQLLTLKVLVDKHYYVKMEFNLTISYLSQVNLFDYFIITLYFRFILSTQSC